ncbi:MAG: HYR domain-containing protein, partial [Bacteroidota bacterium]
LVGTNDDWFQNSAFPGAGQGIIGTSAATSPNGISAADFKALIQGASLIGRNRTYVQRMAVPNLTPRFITPTTGYILLDAVAARDNHTAGGAVDSSAFAGGPDKNGANPQTWTIGVAGVQQKNDLIDVGGHIRREYNFATDEGGDLWGYAFATTRNTSGDAHTDFEVFRTAPVLTGTGISNTGPNGGHTAGFLAPPGDPFYPAGATTAPGDLLVSVDYTNGGQNPQASVRVWIDPNNVDGQGRDTAWANLQAARPFTFTGVFDSGTGAAPYGYAEIRPNTISSGTCASGGAFLYSVVNTTNVVGTAWGNLTAQNAAYDDNMEALVNVEVAINFSAFGLDINPISGPCFNLFGSLCVKTRSSASFTSEMKDFAGPFVFGNFQEVNANAGMDKNLECSVTQVTLDGSSSTPGAIYSWSVVSGSGGNIVSGANTATPVVNAAGCYVLTVTNPSIASCNVTDTVCVVGVPDVTPPTVTCPPAITRTCTSEVPAGATTLAEFIAQGGTASDISGTVNVSYTDGPLVGGSCGGTITRTYNFTDACGNASSCTQIITINDNIPPTISGPADQTFGCNPTIPAADINLITASDNCTGVTVSALPDQISGACTKTLVRTYRATDGCGNTADWVQTFTYTYDVTAPSITASGSVANNSDLGCNPTPAEIEAALGSATATDACGAVTVDVVTDGVVTNGCMRSQTRNFSSTDGCGNTSNDSRTISWKVDLTAPVITATGSVANGADLGCNPSAAAINAALGTATASDNCDIVTVSANDGAVSANGCQNTQTRTFTSTDDCGNTSSVSRTISWKVDTEVPVVTCNSGNGDITVCVGDAGNVSFVSTATDNCDGTVPVNCVRSDGLTIEDAYPVGTTTVTCTATDACGNVGTCSFNVIVLANPTCTLTAPATLPTCGSTGNTLTAASNNATSYSWNVSGSGWAITGGANAATVTYTAGTGPATFTLTVTNSLNGVNCTSTCSVTFECAGDRFCTYTQGYYGQGGGTNCTGLTTKPLLLGMLNGNPLVLGGGSKTLTLTAADASSGCIFLRLPAGGTHAALNGIATCSNPVGIAIKNSGAFGNTLLGQTITLGFNLRVPGSALSSLQITGKYLTTAQSSGSGCVNPTATAVPGTNQTFVIPTAVINWLGANNTVAGLFALANQALAGTLPSGAPSLSQINQACDAFNRGFDKCRVLVGFSNTAPTAVVRDTDGELEPAYDLSVRAYPNPFTQKASIEFSLTNAVENAVVEVYTLNGTKVATLFNGSVEAEKSYIVELDGANLAPGIYVYQVNTGNNVYTNKLILTRE